MYYCMNHIYSEKGEHFFLYKIFSLHILFVPNTASKDVGI